MDSKDVEEKLLPKLEKEIKEIEKEIKDNKKENMKKGFIKNLKISSRFLLHKASYALAVCGVFHVFSSVGITPFIIDNWEIHPYCKNEFDSLGNKEYVEQYDEFGSEDEQVNSTLDYYSKWKKNTDNSYTQIVKTYDINDKTYENVVELFDKDNINLEDILGTPIRTTEITKQGLSQEEINKNSYFKGIIYDMNENVCKVYTEDIYTNIFTSLLFILGTLFAEGFAFYIDEGLLGGFSYYVNKANSKYSKVDVDNLKEKLDKKKKVYKDIKKYNSKI